VSFTLDRGSCALREGKFPAAEKAALVSACQSLPSVTAAFTLGSGHSKELIKQDDRSKMARKSCLI
jgi:hypothetical protein